MAGTPACHPTMGAQVFGALCLQGEKPPVHPDAWGLLLTHCLSTSFAVPLPSTPKNATAGTSSIQFPMAHTGAADSSGRRAAFADNTVPLRRTIQGSSRQDPPPDSYDNQSGSDDGPSIDGASITTMSREHASLTIGDTPKGPFSTRDFAKSESVKDQGKLIMINMGVATVTRPDWIDTEISDKLNFGHDVFSHWLQNKGKDLYGKMEVEGRLVGSKRWVTIPERPGSESELYTPFLKLISKILKDLLKHGRERKVYDRHNKQLLHFEKNYSSPDIVVVGIGSSFEKPFEGKPVGYSNLVTFFEVKLDRELERDETLQQVSVYSRCAS